MLAPGPGGAENLHFDVRRIQSNIRTFHLRQDRYCHRGGMDPSSRLGLGHPLDPVDAALELQAGKSACPLNRKGYFLYASKLCLTAYMEYIR